MKNKIWNVFKDEMLCNSEALHYISDDAVDQIIRLFLHEIKDTPTTYEGESDEFNRGALRCKAELLARLMTDN